MNDLENLPVEELINSGIMDENRNFSNALSKKQIDDFINGGTMLVETEKNKYILNLSKEKDNSLTLNKAMIAKDYKMSFELDNDENKACLSNDVINKNIKGYGQILEIDSKPYLNNPQLKNKTFLLIENEKGEQQEFWGDKNLNDRLKDYKVGDLVQVDFKGINAKTFKDEEEGREYKNNENIFDIKPLDNYEKGKQINKLYAYDKNTNQTISFTPKVENIKEINGYVLNDKDRENLKKGKKIELADGEEVFIDPKIKDNNLKLSNVAKKLLFASVLFDGGLTLAVVLGSKKIIERNEKQKKLIRETNSAKYKESLDKMLAFLQKKKAQYPNEKGITRDINIVKKEQNSMGFSEPKNQKNTVKDIKNIQVNDYDDYEKYNDNKKKNRANDDGEEKEEKTKRRSGFQR